MTTFLKTVTANFETIDLAELAAKNIKNNFSQIKAITIKYKNVPRPMHGAADMPPPRQDGALGGTALVVGAAMGNGMGTTFAGGYPGFLSTASVPLLYDEELEVDHAQPEIKRTTESCLIIKASSEQTRQIEAHLRGIGGQQISVT